MAGGSPNEDLEELGTRFGINLILSEKELGGVCIERKDVEGALLGFQYTLIAEVLTAKAVKGDVFVDCFMSLWRGREGVSIREIGDRRFLARFAGKRDLQWVVEADMPWMFKNDLVLVADRTEKGLNRWTPLFLGVLWVQLHNVPVLSMTQAVAETIGSLMGEVRLVDKTGSRDCIGRFLRVKIGFNVREPLMRGTFVTFPNEGKIWIDFKYESLPNNCLICGKLGHPTRICKEALDESTDQRDGTKTRNEVLAFRGLDAVSDLRGNPLGAGSRSRASSGSNGGRSGSERWNEELGGSRRSGRSSTASGMGCQPPKAASRSQNGSECTAPLEEEVIDTATSPSKPRWSSNKMGYRDNVLAGKI
ncbi:hypothetical protein EV1_046001 [Malus domestica]